MTAEQFLYTNCPAGLRADDAGGGGGYGIRARSPGVTPDRWRAMQPFVSTEPPPEARLAYFTLPGGRPVLLHTVPSAVADDRGRAGFAFNQVLLDLPPGTDALAAANTWGSGGWLRGFAEPTTALPPAALPPPGPLAGPALADRLTDPKVRRAAERVLARLLGPADGKVFLFAPAGVVAAVVCFAARCLPPALRAGLTFSTYERGFHSMPARVLGTHAADADLPASCYAAPNLGLNLDTDRAGGTVPPADAHPYPAFAAGAVADGNPRAVDDFLAACERAGVNTAADLFDLFDLRIAPARLTPASARRLLARPATAAMVADSPDARERIIGWVVGGEAEAGGLLDGLLRAVGAGGERALRTDLCGRLKAAAFAAAEAGQGGTVRTALDRLREVDRDQAERVGTAARTHFSDPTKLPWAGRAELLDAVRRAFGDSPPSDARGWLSPPTAADADDLLRRVAGWPDRWQTLAWTAAADARHLTARSPLAERLALDPGRVVAVAAAVADPDAALAGVYAAAPSVKLAEAFEAAGQPIPPATLAGLLAVPDVTLKALHLRAVVAALSAEPDRLTELLRAAVRARNAPPLFAPAVSTTLGKARLDRLLIETGWAFAAVGDDHSADYALFDARKSGPDPLADAVADADRLAPPARRYLASRLVQRNRLAEVADLLANLSRPEDALDLLRAADERVAGAVIDRAASTPKLWPLVERLLTDALDRPAPDLGRLAREVGEPLARGRGRSLPVEKLVNALFDPPADRWPRPGQSAWTFLLAARAASPALPDPLAAVIDFQQAIADPDAFNETAMGKSHRKMSARHREAATPEFGARLADGLLHRDESARRADHAGPSLFRHLVVDAAGGPLLDLNRFAALLAALFDPARRSGFLHDHNAVAAVCGVRLGVFGPVPHLPPAAADLAPLVQAVRQGGPGAVLRLGRGAGSWGGEQFRLLADLFDTPAVPPPPPPGPPGLRGRRPEPEVLTPDQDAEPPAKKKGFWSKLWGD